METWVIFEEVDKNSKRTQSHSLFSPFAQNKPYFPPKTISELSGKMVVASYNGWLMIADSNDPGSVLLFNPFSQTTINLPHLDLLSEEVVCNQNSVNYVMTCVPDDDKDERCVVMVSWKSLILFCRPGYDDSWGIHHASVNSDVRSHTLGICNGIIYKLVFLANQYALLYRVTISERDDSNLVVTLKSVGQLRWTDLGRRYQSVYSAPYLVESCGELYCLNLFYGHGTYCNDIQDVRIFKFVEKDNTETLDVVQVESLENQALFIQVSNSPSFGCYVPPPTTSGLLQGNCVYILASFDEAVIFKYHLEDRSLTPFPLFPNQKLLWRRPFWLTSAGNKRNLDESEEKEMDTVLSEEDVSKKRHETEFGDLPSDLICRIARRLLLTDYSRFRATCKKYGDLTLPLQCWSSQSSKIEYLETTKSELILPWLISIRGDPKICNVIDPMHTDQIYLITIPWDDQSYAATMEVVYSKNGWLLMNGFAGNLFFYNPFTKVINGAVLPANNNFGHLRCMGSSATPISENGIIVGLQRSMGQLLVHSYIYGDPEWLVTLGCVKGSFIPASNSPVYYKNKNAFYFLDITGRLGRYKITPERRYKWKTFSKPSTPIVCNPLGGMTTYLVECDGEILSVFVSLAGSWVKVFRLNFMKKRWARVDNVKNHMIFLSPQSSFAEVAPDNRPELGNKLYFSRLHQKEGLVCYDLASHRYCSPNNDSMSRENLFQTRELLGCTWIQPTWS
ncbi:uncharacterized protein LOC141657612 [Silene latifolia]|uniref:uncharacterized protein LOC141657612 n=1 Tax=Silene latifolia TaxID=37657 RepID=UPI003D7784C7